MSSGVENTYVLGRMLQAKADELPDSWSHYDRSLMGTMKVLARIQDKNGKLIPYVPNPMQVDYFPKRSQADIILKGRQMGSTTMIQLEYAIEAMTTPGMEVLYIAQRDDSAKRLFEVTTRLVRAIPEELLPSVESDTTHKITFGFGDGHTSTIEIGTAGSKSFGRGRPVHRALFTEVAFYEGNQENTMAGIIAAMPGPDSDIPGRYVMESTANGQSGNFYEQWVAAKAGSSGVRPHFYGWWWDPGYKIRGGPLTGLTDEERYLRESHGLSYDQIRWRRWQLGNYSGQARGAEFFQQEFPESPEQAFMAIGDNVFDRVSIDTAARAVRNPESIHLAGTVEYWEKKLPGERYIVSVDQASGDARDASNKPTDFQVATVWKVEGLEQVAKIRGRIPQAEFADQINLMAKYYNDALVVVERNLAIFGFVTMLYERGVRNMYIHPDDAKVGWPNNKGTKPPAIQNFEAVCFANACKIRSANLISEARNYRYYNRQGTKSMAAGSGGNDDELMTGVMAFLPSVTSQARTIQTRDLTREIQSAKVF